MVCRIMAASAAVVSKQIKTYFGWDKPEAAPMGHHILSKTLRNTGLHTFTGMLGYCIKDCGEDYFECIHWNVTHEEIEEGVEEYVKHGTLFAKNRIILTHKNLMERAATFCRYKLRKQLESTLPGMLLPMLQSDQYIPSASWVLPLCQGCMEYTRSAALWKCMMQPGTLNMDDVTQIFFEHTNPGSHLADLERQRLASTLDEAREGAHSDYMVLGFTLGDVDDVVVLEDTQNKAVPLAQVPDNKADSIVHTLHAPMFIPVVYGDHDDLNSFQL